jgi:hypothetical protein
MNEYRNNEDSMYRLFSGFYKGEIPFYYSVSKINLSILFAAVSFVLCFFYIFIFAFLGLKWAHLGVYPTLSVYIVSLFLIRKRYIDVARFLLVFGTSFSLLCYSFYLGKSSGAPFLLFAMVAVPLSVFEFSKKKWIFVSTITPVFMALIIEFFVSLDTGVLNIETAEFINDFAILTTFLLIFLFIYFYTRQNFIYSNTIEKANETLASQLAEIKTMKVKIDSDLSIAKSLQLNILPKTPLIMPGYSVHYYYSPARVIGGDYLDFQRLDDRRVMVVIADIVGKGIPASLIARPIRLNIATQVMNRGSC